MSTNNGPKCRLCRREGVKLYLKGSRCHSEKCAFNKKPQAPGQHGTSRKQLSEYGRQLREKQKAKRIYGLLEKQFQKYVDLALSSKGITSETLMQRLESRLDNVIYRGGLAVSRAQARQFVRNGLFVVNDKKVSTPSIQLKKDDIIKPVSFDKIHLREGFVMPAWISANVKDKYIKYETLPTLNDLQEDLNMQLIIEFYSR